LDDAQPGGCGLSAACRGVHLRRLDVHLQRGVPAFRLMGRAPLRACARQADGAAYLDLHGLHAGGVFSAALFAQAGLTDAQRVATRRGVTDQSSSVEMSPGFCPRSLAFNTRRVSLPERVLGSEGSSWMS